MLESKFGRVWVLITKGIPSNCITQHAQHCLLIGLFCVAAAPDGSPQSKEPNFPHRHLGTADPAVGPR